MRPVVSALSLLTIVAAAATLTGCDGCGAARTPSEAERNQLLASALSTPAPAPSAAPPTDGIGHAANVIPGQGPKRIESNEPRLGLAFPILPGQGLGPVRFGANQKTIERLMAAPCEEANENVCRYLRRGIDFKLEAGVVKEIKVSRKGREAKRLPDGSIVEYGFYNGAILPDLYFGMQPDAMQQVLGAPQKVEKVMPMAADGFVERHFYDGMTLEYDQWSNGKLVLGAAILTKSESAAAANDKLEAERARKAGLSKPTTVPR